MGKLNLSGLAADLQKKLAKEHPELKDKIGVGNNLSTLDPQKDFIQMPDWWKTATNTPGIAFGRLTMIAGEPDSGKTSAAIVAMRAAQEQGCGVIYIETENKTSEHDLKSWGVDTENILVAKASVAERAYTLLFEAWDMFTQKFPGVPLLVVFDSIGNSISQRDTEIDLLEESQKPGGKGQINRLGLMKMIARMEETNAAVFLVNYTYDNIGSVGKTNAGGKIVNFASSLTYQTSRKKWLYDSKGNKKGAEVVWKLYKNHIYKDKPGTKQFELKITQEGVEFLGGKDGDAE